MRGVVAADPDKPQPAASPRQPGVVDRIVLEHHQRVEQLRPLRPAAGSPTSPRCWCAISADWFACTRRSSADSGSPGRSCKPQRQRVDEQPHHALDAGDLRRTARNRHPEHHVRRARSAAPAASPTPPAARVFSVRPMPRAPARSAPASAPARAHSTICSGATAAAPASRRRQPRRLLQPGKRLAPLAASPPPGPAPRYRPGSRGTASPRQHRAIAAARVKRQQLRAPAPAPTSRPSGDDGCSAAADADPPTSRISANRSSGAAARSNRSTRSAASDPPQADPTAAPPRQAPTGRSAATAPRARRQSPAPDGSGRS